MLLFLYHLSDHEPWKTESKISRWRTYGEYFCSFLFATESVKNVYRNSWVNYCKSACAFHCDKNYRLFVTVVQSEGIFIRFPGPPSRFSFNNCYSGTAMQTSGTVAGIYGIRRLQVKRSGRLGARAVLALDCCRPPET